mgnify:CR=1 FL=1
MRSLTTKGFYVPQEAVPLSGAKRTSSTDSLVAVRMGEQGKYDMDQLVRRGHQSGALQEATGIGLLPLLYAASVLLCEERLLG